MYVKESFVRYELKGSFVRIECLEDVFVRYECLKDVFGMLCMSLKESFVRYVF